MKKGMNFLESPATDYENSFTYRVEWDKKLNYETLKYEGPDSISYGNNYDEAWDCYCCFRKSPDFIGLRLIKINKDGLETTINSK